jgi:hypothetical protein
MNNKFSIQSWNKKHLTNLLKENQEVNDLRKALFATRDLKRNTFAFLEDSNAHELLDNLIAYLEETIKSSGGDI